MSGPKVLVTGASGLIGRTVVDQLVSANAELRALVEHPETAGLPDDIELVGGDLADAASLRRAFEGIDRVFLACEAWMTQAVVTQAARSGVTRVVLLSSASAPWERKWPRAHRHFLAAEQAVEASGPEWTHIRPVGLMAAALSWADSIRREGIVRQGFAAAAYPHVHEVDVAAMAATSLLEDGHVGDRYMVTGPEAITATDQVAAIAAGLGRDIAFEELSTEEAIAQWRADGWDEDSIDIELIVLGDAVEKPVRPRPTVDRVLRRPALSFSQWALDHAGAFR